MIIDLEVLKREGYIRNFSEVEKKPGINFFEIELKYYEGKPVISEINPTPDSIIYRLVILFMPFVQNTNISLLSSYLVSTTNNVKKYVKTSNLLNIFGRFKNV